MTLTKLIIAEFNRRIFDESYPRILKCLDRLSEEQIWYKPNKSSNSIGNLILHLEGNLRQWVTTTFNKNEDKRIRSSEFSSSSIVKKEHLILILLRLKTEIQTFIDNISKEDLEKLYLVQVYDENGISILIHVIEHFSYHTGQIAYITKLIDDKDLDFYTESLE